MEACAAAGVVATSAVVDDGVGLKRRFNGDGAATAFSIIDDPPAAAL